ncbi:hypothetical protein L226DRAFT_518185 [Lentinus tigrinus ALCF2SS1-7]|uniref:uncharacterized protein n=1 Tax=Lentinus tigrinus ALCF2SS1-7 TaxID=1328758 RepID=UPI001165F1EE|nr:hypothetical protein L226DRAFT_518185 [Lentinus tigrinus ALCF2SS1-7]
MEPSYAAQVDYGYMSDQTMAQPCYTPAYDYSSTQQWPLYYSYNDSEYPTYQGDGVDYHQTPCAALPLHAPVPVSNYTTLLTPSTDDASGSTHQYPPSFDPATPPEDCKPEQENPLDVYLDAPQVLFPTPSELLANLNTRERGTSDDGESAAKTSSKEDTSPALGKRKRDVVEKPENLNQRKAYFRAVSDNVGFTITDPDTITSHDKKRSYLECLEEYVQWLHEQIHLVGQKPLPLERISTYRGLKNRSLRTILVHKQNTLQKLNMQKMQAEEKFMELQNAVLMRQAAEDSLQFRRHSIAMGAMPHNVVPSFAP